MTVADENAYLPLEPVTCDACGSSDVLPMPVETLLDRVRWAAFFAPFKCRRCRKKLYRRVKKKSFLAPGNPPDAGV